MLPPLPSPPPPPHRTGSTTPVLNMLSALGVYLGGQVRDAVQAMSADGQPLAGLLSSGSVSGRRLMQLHEEVQDVQEEEGLLDPVSAAARHVARIETYLMRLFKLAEEVYTADEEGGAGTDSSDGGAAHG